MIISQYYKYQIIIFYIQAFPRLTPHSLTWSSLLLLFCWIVLSFAWYVLFLLFSHSVTPMDCSTPCFPVLHYLLEFAQTHVHQVSDAIQPSHPLLSPSPPAFNPSQQQGFFPMSRLFASGGQSAGASASASVLPMNIQGFFFPLGLTGLISLQSKDSQESSPSTTFQKQV